MYEIQSKEQIRSFLLAMRVGDEVLINDRERPLELVEKWWDDRESGYWRYRFEGYGTSYTGIVPPDGTSAITLRSEGGKQVLVGAVEHPEGGEFLLSDTTVSDLGISPE